MQINYKILPDEEYETELGKARAFIPSEKGGDEVAKEVGNLQDKIFQILNAKWKEEDESWYVTWDFNNQYSTYGAIYSKELFSKEYICLIVKAIDFMDEPEKWTYHTVCEIEVNPEGKTYGESIQVLGEFFIKNKTVYIKQSMPKKYRHMLGCPE